MMPPSTPWTSQRSKGYVVSDRIQPSGAGSKSAVQSNKQKQSTSKQQSPEVNRLQKLISYLQNPPPLSKAEDEVGCFCLAQVHKISPHTPLCMSCGLILCELNQPYRPCPFKPCGQDLLAGQARAALIDSLKEKVVQTIAEEEDIRRKEEEERRRAAGAFPELGPGSSPTPTKSSPAAAHKVLSLTQKGAILTTTRKVLTPPPAQSSKVDTAVPVPRVPAPPQQPVRFLSRDLKGDWESLRSSRMVYVPPPQVGQTARGSKKSKNA